MIESFSGVRGIYGKDIDADIVSRYAEAFCTHMKKQIKRPLKLIVARDTRPSAPEVSRSMIDVFSEYADVIDLGISPTPAAEFAVRNYEADGGVIVTASHNEPEFIGWKFLRSDGAVLSPSDMRGVIGAFHASSFDVAKRKGVVTKGFIDEFYVDYVLARLGDLSKIRKSKTRVLVDPNGGAGIDISKKMLNKLKARYEMINDEHGVFSRKVEPDAESLSYLAEKMGDADFAVGFDCDADRAEFILPGSRMISGQHLLALIVDEVLKERKGPVVVNDCTSNMVHEIAKKHGCEVIETEAGEINVVDKMLELGSPVGGEGSSSGAIVSPSRCRDGLMSLAFMLKILANADNKLPSLLDSLPSYYTLRENIETNADYQKIKNDVRESYSNTVEQGDDNGSIKAILDGSFLWFRPSRTEPGILRVMADSPNMDKAKSLLEEGKKLAQKLK